MQPIPINRPGFFSRHLGDRLFLARREGGGVPVGPGAGRKFRRAHQAAAWLGGSAGAVPVACLEFGPMAWTRGGLRP